MGEKLTGNKTPASHWIKLVIFIALTVGFGFLPPLGGGITAQGMQILGLFLGLLFGTIFLDSLIYPALIVMFFLVFFGFKTSGQALQGWLGNPTICTMIAFLVLTDGIKSSGAAEVIAKWIITRKAFQGRPLMFTFFFMFAAFIAGIFLPPTAGMIFFMQIADSCRRVIGYDAKDPWCKWLIVGVSLACVFGTYGLPFKSMIVAIMAPFLGIVKMEVNTALYIVYAYTIGIIFMILYVLLMKLNKVNFEPLKNFDANSVEELQGSLKMTKQQILIIIGFVVAVLYSFLPVLIKTGDAIKFIKTWSLPIWTLFIDAILHIIRIDGKPVLQLEKAFRDGVMWRIVALVGVLTMVSDGLNNPDFGIQPILANFMNSIFGGMSWPVFVLVITVVLVILTNFTSNQVLGMVAGTVIAPIALGYMANGIDLNAFCVIIAFTVECSFMTPAAYATVPIFMGGETMNGESAFLFKKGWQICLIFIIPAVIIITLFGTIFG